MVNRFSSRQSRLDQSFLTPRLSGAGSYDRIAGYFSSSILEVAGEALESVNGIIRVVCNSDLDIRDVETARAANYAIRREWCASEPEKLGAPAQPRFERLFEFLKSGKMWVRVLPSEKFGLVHGKAGVITLSDGNKTSFMGSANETYNAWRMNYELIWEDDSPDAIEWVQKEFDSLWEHPMAVNLADFVIEDIGRLAKRKLIPRVEVWRDDPNPASPIIETPIYRREFGLLEHQKYFAKLAFDAHQTKGGARFVLADQVGLGKTVQLAMAAMLMALYGDKPILVIVPKTLLWQWQDEMRDLLALPSAVWMGDRWRDENGIDHPVSGPEGIKKCPRRIGIVSQGLITRRSEAVRYLTEVTYECVIVDEAHRARRQNTGPNRNDEKADPNNLMSFLQEIAPKTKSLLMATATPVQLHPIEAWDLLSSLSIGNESVLGNIWSNWRRPSHALDVAMGRVALPDDDRERWGWIRNPLPPAGEDRNFELLRRSLNAIEDQSVFSGDAWETLSPPDQDRVRRLSLDFASKHNPFIRHIVRRTREFLETTIDPATSEPYLKPVKVELHGEGESDALKLPPYLSDAYDVAEDFCRMLGQRAQGSGFLKTLLLRRVGSTIHAGASTARRMLDNWQDIDEINEDDEDVVEAAELRSLTPSERDKLEHFLRLLQANQENDPKLKVVIDLLLDKNWLSEGCIIFSQYYDSIWWLAGQLTERFPEEAIGIYAGSQKSGIMKSGVFVNHDREDLKKMVRAGVLRLILGTDAASEGLNLQRLGTLINLDLPWNPTRLEQRKGRIQRIGQLRDIVHVYNMRYRGSVEDRVHDLLSDRLSNIYHLFGQIPDVLEDAWVYTALGEIEKARQTIDAIPPQHPFEIRYNKIEKVSWESCIEVLDSREANQQLSHGW